MPSRTFVPFVVLAALGLTTLTAGAAVASIPGPDGVIHACYQSSTGALRVVESGVPCRGGETALQWNQVGPPGPQGPPGPEGPPGPSGSVGYATVNFTGELRPLDSLNIHPADLVKPSGTSGLYCFLDTVPQFDALSFALRGHFGIGHAYDRHTQGVPSIDGACPPGTRIVVVTRDPATLDLADRNFYLVLH